MYIPELLEAAFFRALEQLMIKAPSFINGYSLKKGGNEEHDFLNRPRRAGLKMLYAALLLSTMEQPFSSNNALPIGFLIPAEICIFM